MNKPIHELTQEEYESLPPREHAAVTRHLLDIEAGRLSPSTSMNDLTPSELADEREAEARAILASHPVFKTLSPEARAIVAKNADEAALANDAALERKPGEFMVYGASFRYTGKARYLAISIDSEKVVRVMTATDLPRLAFQTILNASFSRYANDGRTRIVFDTVTGKQVSRSEALAQQGEVA